MGKVISVILRGIAYMILIIGVVGGWSGFAFGPADNINPTRFFIFSLVLVLPPFCLLCYFADRLKRNVQKKNLPKN